MTNNTNRKGCIMSVKYRVTTRQGTIHSDHESYKDAVDQADLIHGVVYCGPYLATPDITAYRYAVNDQGFFGDYSEWRMLEDSNRDEYEHDAAT